MIDKEKMLFKWLNFSKDFKEREERANAGMSQTEKSNLKDLDSRSKKQRQEDAILEIIKRMSLDPLALPPYKAGKNGSNVKGAIREIALTIPELFTKDSFKNTWDHMRSGRAIKDQ